MEYIKTAIEEYIKTPTSYAILITGKWGIGKTHYYHNELVPFIKTIPSNKKATTAGNETTCKYYKPIYISLFGLKSVEDVQAEIFISLSSILSNDKVKKGGKLLVPLLSGVMKKFSGIDLSEIVESMKDSDFDYTELVLCFDDLERKHSKLTIEELTGFLNHLTEREKAKVIIIANEEQIEGDRYKVIKEKVISNTINFVPVWKDQVNSFMDSKYKENKYPHFISKINEDIANLLYECDANLRTLDFALSKLHTVWSKLNENKYEYVKPLSRKVINQFVFLSAILYKTGKVDYLHGVKIKSLTYKIRTYNDIEKAIENQQKGGVLPPELYFVNQVQSLTTYRFYIDSIFSYVTGGASLNVELLTKEIEQLESSILHSDLPQIQLFKQMQDRYIMSFTDEEYLKLHEKVTDYAFNGDYPVGAYPTIFWFLMQFGEELFDYKPNILADRLKEGIRKAKGKLIHNYKSSFPFIGEEKEYIHIEALNSLSKEVKDTFKQLDIEENKARQLAFRENFEEEWKEKIEHLKSGAYASFSVLNEDLVDTVYITACSSNEFCKELMILSDSIRGKREDDEIKFFKLLRKKLEPTSKSRQEKNISNLTLNMLSKRLDVYIERTT